MPNDTPQQFQLTTKNTLSLTLGIIATIIGVVSLLIGWIPFLGLFAIPCAAIGLLLAITGGIIALCKKGKGIGLPILGGVICAAGFLLPVFSTGGASIAINQALLDAQKRRTQNADVSVVPKPGVTPNSPEATTHPPEPNRPTDPEKSEPKNTWSDANNALRIGDILVTIRELKVGKVQLKDMFGEDKQSNDQLLTITIELKNLSEVKKIDFRGWSADRVGFDNEYATLADDNENTYKRINFGASTQVVGSITAESIYPSAIVTEVLVFEKPVDAVKWLHLELPAKNFKAIGIVRFEIPSSMIRR